MNPMPSQTLWTLAVTLMSNPFNLYNQFRIAIIEDTVDNCINNFTVLLQKGGVSIKETDDVNFQKVYDTPDVEYTPSENRFLLYEPSSNPSATVFFTNFVDGWYTAVYNYTRLFHKQAFLVGFTLKAVKYEPAWLFHCFKNEGGEVSERVVHLIKEDKWVFHESGVPLKIEDVTNYSRRYKRDRLNNEIILGYLRGAGYDLSQDYFYKTNNSAYLCKYR